MTDIATDFKLEIGNTDLYHTGMRVKWDPFKQWFTTGTMAILGLNPTNTRLSLNDVEGYIREVNIQQEFGAFYVIFEFVPDREELSPTEVDIFETIFTLLTPVAVSKF